MDINGVSAGIQEILKNFESNPIIPLIASGGITVWVISNIKAIWNAVSGFVVQLVSFNVFNTYEDNRSIGYMPKLKQRLFNELITGSATIWERTMNLDYSDHENYTHVERNSRYKDRNLTYGFSIKIMFGKLVLCDRRCKQDSHKIMMNTCLKVFFANKRKFMEKLDAAVQSKFVAELTNIQQRSDIQVFYGSSNHGFCSKKNKRRLDSIFTNNDEHIELYEYIRKFIGNRDSYMKMNYPYKLSLLLEGEPGCGKSSTILAIASELNRDIEYVNLSTASVVSLMDKLNENTDRKIFVFEDIDALDMDSASNRENERKSGQNSQMCVINNESGIKVKSISLSDLLNITDGLLSSDGSICIFTTNHVEKLDPALLRAGRMNKIMKFQYLNSATASRMVKSCIGYDIDGLRDGIKPAELQEDLLGITLGKATTAVLDKYRK